MANGRFIVDERQNIIGLLQKFLQSQQQFTGETKEEAAKAAAQQFGFLGLVPQPKSILQPGAKKILREVEQLNPLQENVLKAVQKVHKKQVEEAMAQGASGEQVSRDAGISIAKEQPTDEEGKPTNTALALAGIQPPELTEDRSSVVKMLENVLSLGGLIKPSAQDQLALAQTEALRREPGKLQQLQTEYDLKLRNKIFELGVDPESPMAKAKVFSDDVNNLISIYDRVNLKGRLGGMVGAVGGAIGYQREERAEFKAAAESMVYSVASSIAGQEGRGLSDRDIELVSSWAKFKLNDRRGDFVGKMNNLIKKAKARGVPLPTLEEIRSTARGQTMPGTKAISSGKTAKGTSWKVVE